jgi:transcription initiation factor IIE alpha subunit
MSTMCGVAVRKKSSSGRILRELRTASIIINARATTTEIRTTTWYNTKRIVHNIVHDVYHECTRAYSQKTHALASSSCE